MNVPSISPGVRATLGEARWMIANAESLQNLFPEQWTPLAKVNAVDIGLGLKAIGVDWRSADELTWCLAYLQQVGIMMLTRDGKTRRGQLVIRTET